MVSNKILVFVGLLALAATVSAGGRRDYDDECSITSQVSNIFTSDSNDDPNACNTDKGLICGPSRRCTCLPGHVFEKSGILSVFSGGKCVVAANFPCSSKESTCAANAECDRICRCREGYHAKDGFCSNGSGKISISAFYLIGLIASYFLLIH